MTIMKDNFSKMRSFMAKNIPSEVNAETLKKEIVFIRRKLRKRLIFLNYIIRRNLRIRTLFVRLEQ